MSEEAEIEALREEKKELEGLTEYLKKKFFGGAEQHNAALAEIDAKIKAAGAKKRSGLPLDEKRLSAERHHFSKEEALTKTGPELFKELLRLYETAEVEDYMRAGQWRDDLLRTDFVLIEAHRKEAGAPDPPELADVIMPEMPKAGGLIKPMLTVAGPAAAPAANGAFVTIMQTLAGPDVDLGCPRSVTVSGFGTDLRLAAVFVTKWKLDPVKTKTLLVDLTSQRRRFVQNSFKTTGLGDVNAELEQYIADCETKGDWDKIAAPGLTPTVAWQSAKPAPTAAWQSVGPRPASTIRPALAATIPAATGGVKRPMLSPSYPAAQKTASASPAAQRLQQLAEAAEAQRLQHLAEAPASPAAQRLQHIRQQQMGGGTVVTPSGGQPGGLAARLAAARAASAVGKSPPMIAPRMLQPQGALARTMIAPRIITPSAYL